MLQLDSDASIAPTSHVRESKCRKLESKVGSLQRISPRGS